MSEGRRWRLRISSFKGVVPWARHYMGRIERDHPAGLTRIVYGGPDATPEEPKYDVEFTLNAEQAKALNEEEEVVAAINGYSAFVWREGMETGRFEDRDVLIAAAVALFQKVAAPGDALVDDDDEVYARLELEGGGS